jgi:hypothetical protein
MQFETSTSVKSVLEMSIPEYLFCSDIEPSPKQNYLDAQRLIEHSISVAHCAFLYMARITHHLMIPLKFQWNQGTLENQ